MRKLGTFSGPPPLNHICATAIEKSIPYGTHQEPSLETKTTVAVPIWADVFANSVGRNDFFAKKKVIAIPQRGKGHQLLQGDNAKHKSRFLGMSEQAQTLKLHFT